MARMGKATIKTATTASGNEYIHLAAAKVTVNSVSIPQNSAIENLIMVRIDSRNALSRCRNHSFA